MVRHSLSIFVAVVGIGEQYCADHSFKSPDYGTDTTRESTENEQGDSDTDFDTDVDGPSDTDSAAEIPLRYDVDSILSAPADFRQSDDDDGLVVMEAETYTIQIAAMDRSYWETVTAPEGYLGDGTMKAGPSGYVENKEQPRAQENAPILIYTIDFVKAEPVFVWARAYHIDGYDDSVWFGRDGSIVGTSSLSFWDTEHIYAGSWYYIHFLMEGGTAVLDIPKAGKHTFELYVREPDFLIDQILLTTNPAYDPRLTDISTSTPSIDSL